MIGWRWYESRSLTTPITRLTTQKSSGRGYLTRLILWRIWLGGIPALFFLLGQDALAGFRKWHKPERILELATLALLMRSGAPDVGDWRRAEGLVVLSTRRVDVSSTEIRERLRDDKSIKGFVPEGVERFIEARGLYR
jgi:nicotinic acid mononucleotide adenylyltransferase